MQQIKPKFGKVDAIVQNLLDEIKGLDTEVKHGRNAAWKKEATRSALQKARAMIDETKTEITKTLLLEGGRINDMVQPSEQYAARTYNLQLAQALAQGKSGEELIKVYQNLDREHLKYKGEFERVFSAKMDPEYHLQWQEVIDQQATPEERAQNEARRQLELVQEYLPTMGAHIEGLLEEAAGGEIRNSLSVYDAFTAAEQEINRRLKQPLDLNREEARQLAASVNPYIEEAI